MIIKIERYIDRAENDPGNWWMVDGIKRLHRIEFESPLDFEADGDINAETKILDYGFYLDKMEHPKPTNRRVIRLNCKFKDDNESSIVFDTICYVLNDDGKTIERLVANYR